jgi:hypothetical protein
MIVRPVQVTDLPALLALARQAGCGLTSLPANEERLLHRLRWAQRTFAEQVERADADYLFVLEDDDQRGGRQRPDRGRGPARTLVQLPGRADGQLITGPGHRAAHPDLVHEQ